MKRVFISIIAIVAALNLGACSDNSEPKSKIKEKTSSKVETQDTTEKETLPVDDNKYTMVDAFDKITTDLSGIYPTDFHLFYNTYDSTYCGKIDYDCTIKSADLDKIVIEAKADYSKYEDDLKERGYKFESDSKIYEIDLNEISSNELYTNILHEDQLTDENIKTIIDYFSSTVMDKSCIEKVYALIPANNLVFLEDYNCTDKFDGAVSSDGYEEKLRCKIPKEQIFVITNSYYSGYEVYSFEVWIKNNVIEQCVLPHKNGVRDESGQLIDTKPSESSIDDYFAKTLSWYREKGDSFKVKEITIPKE